MSVLFENDWNYYLKDMFDTDVYRELRQKLIYEYSHYEVFPDMYDIFNALHLTSYNGTKVVILGQDPYHDEGQATGLSFSVPVGISVPPSLKNIYKELNNDLGLPIPESGDLTKWAKQGVLLLNSVLTVRAHSPASHRGMGWESFTDFIIAILNERTRPVVFIFWGNYADSKRSFVTNRRHLVINSPHPSPLSASRGFFGSAPFSKTNEFLVKNGEEPIDWDLTTPLKALNKKQKY